MPTSGASCCGVVSCCGAACVSEDEVCEDGADDEGGGVFCTASGVVPLPGVTWFFRFDKSGEPADCGAGASGILCCCCCWNPASIEKASATAKAPCIT